MTTLFIADDYEALLSPLRDGIRPTLSNDTLQLLENFSLAESDGTITGVSLNANGLTVTANSLDPSDSTIYTVRISGSGIAPVTSLDGLREALDAGTANGSINQISIDYGAQRVAQFDIAPGSLALSSGTQRLELTGGFPVTLTDIITFADTLFGEIDGTLDAYAFTGMTLTDNNQQIFNISLDDGSLRLEYEGFTIVAEDFSLSLQDVFTFLEPPRGQIIPQLRLLDSEGHVVRGEIFSFSNDEPNALRVAYANLPTGTYYAEISARPDSAGPEWQMQTGLYQLYSSFWFGDSNPNQPTFENAGDAPASIETPYILNSGASFFGAVDFTGDADWVRIEFQSFSGTTTWSDGDDSGESFTIESGLSLLALGTGQPEQTLFDFPGLSFSSLTITDPDGDVIISATDIENFADFLIALDDALQSLGMSPVGGFAFATGDPHLMTLDGLGYGFHAAGEYVLFRATNGFDFELQSRMSPAGENVTANVAAALRVANDTIIIAPGANQLLVNGDVVSLSPDDGQHNMDWGRIERSGSTYEILVYDPAGPGSSIIVVDVFAERVDIGLRLSTFWMNRVEGLLGNFNGRTGDDLVLADGTPITFPLVFGDDEATGQLGLYGQFRDDWRVNEETTLFGDLYAEGEGPDSFYLPDYPTQMITLDGFSEDDRAAAEAAAQEAGLEPGTPAFNNAVLDLLVTGDESFLQSHLNIQEAFEDFDIDQSNIVTPTVTPGGITDSLLALSGKVRDMTGNELDGTVVTFRPEGRSVNLTRNANNEGDFSFSLSGGASGTLQATRAVQDDDPQTTILDALNILRMAVGITPSFGEAKAQNFIAADLTGDGQVTVLDALEALRAAVGIQSANAPRWVFFDAATDFEGLNLSATNTHVPQGVAINPMEAAQSGVDMVGILLGNMVEYA